MEARTITLTPEKAKEFYNKGGEFRDLALSAYTEEELNPSLPKTWEEFCNRFKIHEEYHIDSASDIIKNEDDYYRDPLLNRNLLVSKEAANQHLVLMQLHRLRDCYRQDWKPDWKDTSMPKYCIYYVNKEQKFDIGSFSERRRREFLAFQSRKLAEEFLNNFRELILQAGDLI